MCRCFAYTDHIGWIEKSILDCNRPFGNLPSSSLVIQQHFDGKKLGAWWHQAIFYQLFHPCINGLVQDCSIPTANAIKISQSSINSLWPSDAIWWHRTWSTLAQVMACCLTAPSHYLNQCWLIISKVPSHSSGNHFTKDNSAINHWNLFENYMS